MQHVPAGFGLMYVAGVLSGLLGIGSGAVKVLAMDQAMRLPFKVSTTTSNFMIGVTAAASAGVYLHRGYIDPGLAMPVVLGVLLVIPSIVGNELSYWTTGLTQAILLLSLGLLVPIAGENVVRIFPALIADKAALDEGIAILEKAAQSFEAAKAAE